MSSWYERNREAVSAARKKRYAEDPAFKKAAIARSRQYRLNKRVEPCPPGYEMNLEDLAEKLEVTIWVLRGWREKNYFPEPRMNARQLWFTSLQVQLIAGLAQFMKERGPRVSSADKSDLEDLVGLIYSNWE